jgi:hypothetical protein
MKAQLLGISVIAVAAVWLSSATAQTVTGKPEDNKLTPRTGTFYVNLPPETTPPDNVNNGNVESLGVGIADNGNILIGWEDDGGDLLDLEAVWTMYDATGTAITPNTLITSQDPAYAGLTVSNRFLSYFRADGSAVSGRNAAMPKIKANLFGSGIGMGASAWEFGLEIAELAGFDPTGDFPIVQLLSSDGKPGAILKGVPEDYAAADGNIRLADWDFLSNGNIVIVGESRQEAELVDKYGGEVAGKHIIFRIVDKTGNEIKPVALVSATPTAGEMWHGVGVTKNGFGVRWSEGGRATVRLFDNSGTPITTNLDIGTLTGSNAIAAGGGRGDGAGFHGNGNNSYVLVNSGTDTNGAVQVWVTVLSTNGAVRYSKAVCETNYVLATVSRLDATIDKSGHVFAVWGAKIQDDPAPSLVMGRVLDATGKPIGGTFYVSEADSETTLAAYESRNPRVTVQGDAFMVVWQSKNAGAVNPDTLEPIDVVAARLFGVTFVPGGPPPEMTRIVPDTVINLPDYAALGNWEPYSSVLGNSVFLIEGNTFATNTSDMQNYVIMLQPVDGSKPPKLMNAFYTDAGQPYADPINTSRQNGNPGRVAGDKRPGATNFIVGAEATPEAYADFFNSDGRFDVAKAFWAWTTEKNNRHGCVQTYSLDLATLTPTMRSKVQDSAFGRSCVDVTPPDTADGGQISRFGGELACLDNGNFVSVVNDRSRMFDPNNHSGTATIFAPDGTVVKEAWEVAPTELWSNVCAYRGGWAVRLNGIIYFLDNDGNLKGQIDQATCGRSFDRGRGDGTRIQSHINSPYVFLTGTTGGKLVSLAVFDSRDFSFVAVNDVSEAGFPGSADRVGLAVDALNRVVVSWTSQPKTEAGVDYEMQQVAARVMAFNEADKSITALTPSFLPFINAAWTGGITSLQMNPAITTKQVMIAAKGTINLENKPNLGADSPAEVNFYTVLAHPVPMDDPTTPVGGPVTRPTLTIVRSASVALISWPTTATGFTLYSTPSLSAPVWTAVGTANPAVVSILGGANYYQLKK